MGILKVAKDRVAKALNPGYVPEGLVDLLRYSKDFGSIHFQFEKDDGVIIAKSTNFRYGSIITSGKNEQEIDQNIKDAILTAFEIPSAYASEAKIVREGEATTAKYVAA